MWLNPDWKKRLLLFFRSQEDISPFWKRNHFLLQPHILYATEWVCWAVFTVIRSPKICLQCKLVPSWLLWRDVLSERGLRPVPPVFPELILFSGVRPAVAWSCCWWQPGRVGPALQSCPSELWLPWGWRAASLCLLLPVSEVLPADAFSPCTSATSSL